jgi:hypothetical protein
MNYLLLGVFGLLRLLLLFGLWWSWMFLEARIDFLNASQVQHPAWAMVWVGIATCLTFFSIWILLQQPKPQMWKRYLWAKSFEILGWVVLAWMAMEPIFRTVIALDRTDVKIIAAFMLLAVHVLGLLIVKDLYQAKQK